MSARQLKKIAASMELNGYPVKPNNGPGTPGYRPKATTARKRRGKAPRFRDPRLGSGPLAAFLRMADQMVAAQRKRNAERRQERLDRRRGGSRE